MYNRVVSEYSNVDSVKGQEHETISNATKSFSQVVKSPAVNIISTEQLVDIQERVQPYYAMAQIKCTVTSMCTIHT
jgi:hypothetical protein